MVANLRAEPIEGHVTDSAGNVLRNAVVVIKQLTPTGSYVVDTVQSDDDGYFISKPIPAGVYDIYESGIKISRVIHQTIGGGIQCFKADTENYDLTKIGNFQTLAETTPPTLQKYKAFIQLEPGYIDVAHYGSIFPIYDQNILAAPEAQTLNELNEIAKFFDFSDKSRITVSRFDVEYFSPLTALSSSYKRIRWAGVPAIRLYGDSKLIIPLDYFSIVPNLPKITRPTSDSFGATDITVTSYDPNYITITEGTGSQLSELVQLISQGDIIKLRMKDNTTPWYWYGIVVSMSSNNGVESITLEKWKSSRFLSDDSMAAGKIVDKLFVFDGLFPNIMNIDEEINQRFTIIENIFAQDSDTELYNYNNQ